MYFPRFNSKLHVGVLTDTELSTKAVLQAKTTSSSSRSSTVTRFSLWLPSSALWLCYASTSVTTNEMYVNYTIPHHIH